MNTSQKIKSKEAVIGVVGLGYVGLPLVLRFIEEKFKVVGFDIDSHKVAMLSEGKSYIEHIPSSLIQNCVQHNFVATTDFSKITSVDAIIICVPTPLDKHREPDLSYIVDTMENIKPYIRAGQVISLESTTYPGTTDEEIVPRIESRGLKVGRDIYVVYSPEREDPGRKDHSTRTIPKVCGGFTNECLEIGLALYSQIIDKVVPVSSTRTAEMVKLLENIHRAVNIGLVNEMKIVADRMGIDIHEVIKAAATKPFGFVAYYPGPGLGGHCIPIDPFYLTWKAREYGLHTRFIELAGEINSDMPKYVVQKTVDALNDRGLALKDRNILILGLAYKKNVDDVRESPSFEVIRLLQEKGAKLFYSDPHVAEFIANDHYNFSGKSINLSPENLQKYDAVLLVTDHDKFDYEVILKNSRLIIDSRGRFQGRHGNVIKA